VAGIEPLADLFELRIDLVGDGWEDIAGRLTKPWIATNRLAEEGGRWKESEARRKEELLKALGLGAAIIDIELGTRNLDKFVPLIKKRAECLISYHNMNSTPPLEGLKKIVARQLTAGADIVKVVTAAGSFEDNFTMLKLIGEFPHGGGGPLEPYPVPPARRPVHLRRHNRGRPVGFRAAYGEPTRQPV